jgi:phosphohistidine swiveling domain-containing protein
VRSHYLADFRQKRLPASIGNKATNLLRLQRKGFPIPVTYVCSWEAYARYLQDDVALVEALQAELSRKLPPTVSYAVRSSANLEDAHERSFAGQFKSVLNVRGVPALLQAIWSIWATTQSTGVHTYLERHALEPASLRMAVLIQEMVTPVVSGVAFSRNPITGIDEIVVEAVHGSGTALMHEGITPYRWTHRWGQWQTQPEQTDIDRAVIDAVVAQTRRIVKAFQHPVDLEWVYDGQSVYWVQLREITSARHAHIYSNRMAKEMLPGLIKPLIWSVNVPLVTACWGRILAELIGPHDLAPESLARAFYYRTYFDMGTLGDIFERLGLPRESLEILMLDDASSMGSMKMAFRPSARTLARLPRLAAFVADKWFFARRLNRELPDIETRYRAVPIERAAQMNERELLAAIDELDALNRRTAYFNIVGPLLMFMYVAVLRGQLKKLGLEFADFDLTHGLNELEHYAPGPHLRRLCQQFAQLPSDVQTQLRSGDFAAFSQLPDGNKFKSGVEAFLRQFGHLSDSGNDFSATPWRETPDLVLAMAANYQLTDENGPAKVGFVDLPLSGPRRWWLSVIHRRARQFCLFRERISSLYTYGYGLFRVYFRALGEHLVRRGVLNAWTDIFYLDRREIRQVVTDPTVGGDYAARVESRRREMEQVSEVVLPSVIYGETAPPPVTAQGSCLRGTATSQGFYSGPARVVRGIQDFPKVREGDVIVIPYSDVGWTPLFAHAGAVIAESGGMLSHSSIIAREYNIPAVVSVSEAHCLRDDMRVTVNGFTGEVILEEADGCAS